MAFYIEESDDEYESDVDNIYNDNNNYDDNDNYKEPNIINDIPENNKKSHFGMSFEDVLKNLNFDWFFKRMICLEEEIIDVTSVPSFNNKKIKSDDIFKLKNCSQCSKQNIETTFCCLVRNDSYYFCNSECWSLWINKTNKSSNDNIHMAENMISNI